MVLQAEQHTGTHLVLPSAMHRPASWLTLRTWVHAGLDPEDPAYLEVALAVADLHVQAGDAVAAHAVMQAVHAALEQVSPGIGPYRSILEGCVGFVMQSSAMEFTAYAAGLPIAEGGVKLLPTALWDTDPHDSPVQDEGQQHLKALPLVMRRARLLLQLGQEVRELSHCKAH